MNIDYTAFYSEADLPDGDLAAVEDAYQEILGRHLLAAIRESNGQTLIDVADQLGVTKAAVHQAENRPLTDMKIGTFLKHLNALDHPVDSKWFVRTIAASLLPRASR